MDLPFIAVIAAAAALWTQIRSIIDRVRGLFIQRTTLDGCVSYSVTDYLYATTPHWRWGDMVIRSISAWVRPRERVLDVAFEVAPVSPVVAVWRGRVLMFSAPQGGDKASGMPDIYGRMIITTLRGTLNVTDLIKEAMEWQSLKETTGRRYRVVQVGGKTPRSNSESSDNPATPATAVKENMRPGTRFLHWKEDEIGAPRPDDPFNSYTLGNSTSECRNDFRRWCDLKNWYLERGIPWRRGHLLYGPPGTGKTALVRALAQEADFPVYAYDLSTLSNEEFRRSWSGMQECAPCIALIEDIDGVFHGRTNILAQQEGMRSSLTFDCLLNALGGIQTADGVFVVITTNKPETLDDALGKPGADGGSSRPGRLDRAFCIPPLDDTGRKAIITRICGASTLDDITKTSGFTAAQVTEYAISKALADTWES